MKEMQRDKTGMIKLHIALIFTISLLLIYDHYPAHTNAVVRERDPKFRLLGPWNNESYKTTDEYEKLIDIKNFTFITNPQPCKDYPAGFLLLIIVTSSPGNYENRQVIRFTWGKTVDSTRLVFLLGESDNVTHVQHVKHEIDTYNDIVQGSFKDAYRNMTYKHVMGLKWVAHHCQKAKYVLKTDDDVVLHAREMRKFLAHELSPWGATDLIACNVLLNAPVFREKSKWQVSVSDYADAYYPTYCAGWSVLYSQDVVYRLLEVSQETPYFWIDDVHITGTVAQQAGIPRTSLTDLMLSWRQTQVLQTLGPGYIHQFLFASPDLTAKLMMKIWKAIPA